MRHILTLVLLLLGMNASAQHRMAELFLSMPDSLMPLLNEKLRKDVIDFYDNHMEAKVRNVFDEYVELQQLTDDYLRVQTSDRSRTELKLLHTADSTAIVALVRTVRSAASDSQVRFFTDQWQSLQWIRFPVPSVADFCADAPAALEELPLIEVQPSADAPEFTLVLQTGELDTKEKDATEPSVHPVIVRWEDDSFVTISKP